MQVPVAMMLMSLLLLMATAAISRGSAELTITITANKSHSDCHPPAGSASLCTLEQFQKQYMSGELSISANTILDFMPGTHLLASDLKVNDTNRFVMYYRLTGGNTSNVNITCTRSASFDFVNISLLEIDQIMFFGCGSWPTDRENNGAAIKIANTSEVRLSNITILHSRGSAIAAVRSSLTISDTSIVDNNGSGLIVESCAKVTFHAGLVQFLNNTTPHSGGAIRAKHSIVNTSDEVRLRFIGNSASRSGGAICSLSSVVSIFGECNFTGNSANCSGGALYSSVSIGGCHIRDNAARSTSGHTGVIVANTTSFVTVNGTTTFKHNSARKYGGAICANNTILSMIGGTAGISFIENTSRTKGGAICAWGTQTSLSGNITFSKNNATVAGGAIDVEITKDFQMSGAVLFEQNSAITYGGAIEVLDTDCVNIGGEVCFSGNHAYLGGAIFALGVWRLNVVQLSENVTFANNYAGKDRDGDGYDIGGAVMLVNTALFVLNGSINFEGNSAKIGGAIAAMNVSNMTVIGTSSEGIRFQNNNVSSYGGALYMESSYLELHRNVCFVKNSADHGGGVYLNEKSHFFLADNVQVVFQENNANHKGGGVFLDSDEHMTTCLPPSGTPTTDENNYIGPLCTLLLKPDTNATVYFVNNTAGSAGYAWYGGSVDTCSNNFFVTDEVPPFDKIVKIEQGIEQSTSNVSSDPYKVCSCSPNGTECEGTRLNITKWYPGKNFTLQVLAFGQRNGSVPATIIASKASMNFSSPRHPQDTNTSCSNLTYAILPQSNFRGTKRVALELLPVGSCNALSDGLKVTISLHECPIGFTFCLVKGCDCSHDLVSRGYTDECSIDNQTILRREDKNFWVGINDSSLILYPNCPFDYCKSDTIWVPMNDTKIDKLCNHDRTKLLCGQCKDNFSLMLGSSACTKDCSNWHLFLILAFAVAGLALLVFLFALKLTVAEGTINGLVFYANIVHIQRTLFFSSKDSFLTVFIAWINLDLGIPTCFYQGMAMYDKTWLQFVFPVYIWALCGLLIFLSSKSSKLTKLMGNNPVAVLSTLFLLSYTKLVKTVIVAAFSFAELEYTNGHKEIVWLFDANISTAKHISLIIVGLLMFFLLFPYTVLLFASQWFQRWSNHHPFLWMNSPRVKFFLDTYHAPFKPKYRYWTGLLLIVRFVLQVIVNNAYSPVNSNLVVCAIILLLIMWQLLLGSPYCHSFHNILEVLFLVHLEILTAASLYCHAVQSCDRDAITWTSAGVAFAVFVMILLYHSYLRLKESGLWPASCSKLVCFKHRTKGTERLSILYSNRDRTISFPA